MEITEQDRLDLLQRLTETIGENAAAVLMEAIPPVDYSQLATKNDVELLGRELRAEIATVQAEMTTRFAEAELARARDLRLLVTTNVGTMLGLAGLILGFG